MAFYFSQCGNFFDAKMKNGKLTFPFAYDFRGIYFFLIFDGKFMKKPTN